jgi:pimeloyl-ACP methyl ester carboxylesterase
MAIEHPHRLASLTSVMSMPGDPAVGKPTPEAITTLLAPPPTERDAYIDHSENSKVWCSSRYFDREAVRARAAREFDRAFYPQGAPRQLAAIYASGDRSEALRHVEVPTLVIHGREDTLITPSGGERTAELVPGARYLLVSDMGHDIPEPLWPAIAESIVGHIRTASSMTVGAR